MFSMAVNQTRILLGLLFIIQCFEIHTNLCYLTMVILKVHTFSAWGIWGFIYTSQNILGIFLFFDYFL